MLSFLLAIACSTSAPTQVPRSVTELGPSDGVAAADFDGDGNDDPVLLLAGTATWLDHSVELGGQLQASARMIAGDREVLWVATGAGRVAREASQRVWRLDHQGAELVWERRTGRSQVPQLRVLGSKLWMAAFQDRSKVQGGWLTADGTYTPELVEGLATVQVPLSDTEVLVGRIYGDKPKSDGDLRLMTKSSKPRVLPTRRGLQSLALADLNADGHPELLVGDGWHYAYGEHAVARVRMLVGPDWQEGRTLAGFDDDYSVRAIDLVGERILAVGTRQIHLLERDPLGWSDTVVSTVDESGWAVPLWSDGAWSVLVSGTPTRLVPLPGA